METHLSLTGASGKVGLYYDSLKKQWYLPKGRAASTHIVKQSHVRLNRIVFNYLIGNTDCHVKNYSLLYSSDFKSVRLAPAYDIVCTRIYGTTNEMSFYVGGELDITKINRDTFIQAADEVGLGRKLAMKNFDLLSDKMEACIDAAAYELNQMGFQDALSVRDAVKEVIFKK